MNKEYCKDCSHCSLWWKDEYVYQLEQALDLLLEWVTDCDWGYDNIPDLYEKYKEEICSMGYIE